MDVHPALLTREEEDSNAAFPENRRTYGVPAPNGWRVSGERGGEADERVRCTRVLGAP